MAYTVAVVGASGNVGREILSILSERQFPVDRVHAVASSRSVGQEVSFGEDKILKIEDLDFCSFPRLGECGVLQTTSALGRCWSQELFPLLFLSFFRMLLVRRGAFLSPGHGIRFFGVRSLLRLKGLWSRRVLPRMPRKLLVRCSSLQLCGLCSLT